MRYKWYPASDRRYERCLRFEIKCEDGHKHTLFYGGIAPLTRFGMRSAGRSSVARASRSGGRWTPAPISSRFWTNCQRFGRLTLAF